MAGTLDERSQLIVTEATAALTQSRDDTHEQD